VAKAVIEADKTDSEMEEIAPQQIHISVPIDILRREKGVFAGCGHKGHHGEGTAAAQREGRPLL
jgi:hypothetical protein